jgi:hypothetical protein
MAVDSCFPAFATEQENTPQAIVSLKPVQTLVGAALLTQILPGGGALVVRGTLKSESTSLLYIRVRGRYGVGFEGHEVESWARVGNGLLKRQHQMAHF